MKVNKALVTLIILALVASSFILMQERKKVIFFGDSITQLGVNADGYITILQQMLKETNLSDRFELIGSGVSGNKVYDLYLRMDEVLAQKPYAVVIWIGVNDVWHKELLHTGTDADKFEKFYRGMIAKMKAAGIRVFLCTPAVIGEQKSGNNPLDAELNSYSDIIRKVAADEKLGLIDFRQTFLQFIGKHNSNHATKGLLTYDGVHLNAAGNRFVALQLYDELKANIFAAN